MHRLAAARVTTKPAIGLGEQLLLDEPGIDGFALANGGGPVHLYAASDRDRV